MINWCHIVSVLKHSHITPLEIIKTDHYNQLEAIQSISPEEYGTPIFLGYFSWACYYLLNSSCVVCLCKSGIFDEWSHSGAPNLML